MYYYELVCILDQSAQLEYIIIISIIIDDDDDDDDDDDNDYYYVLLYKCPQLAKYV